MPSTPYAAALCSVNGGTPTAGGQVVATGATLQWSPANTAGWTSARWELTATPPGFTAPTGWSQDDALGSVTGFPNAFYYASSGGSYSPPVVTLTPWGKIICRLRVNGAIAGNDPTGFLTDWTSGANAFSPNGIPDFAAEEQGQFGGWDEQIRVAYRAIDAKLTALAAAGGGTSNTVTPVAITATTATVSGTPGYIKLTGATGASTVTIGTGFEITIWNSTAYAATITNTHGGTAGQFTIPAGQSVTLISDATSGVSVSDTVGAP